MIIGGLPSDYRVTYSIFRTTAMARVCASVCESVIKRRRVQRDDLSTKEHGLWASLKRCVVL